MNMRTGYRRSGGLADAPPRSAVHRRSRIFMTPKKKRQLLLAGGFGLAAAGMLLVAPELGAIGAVGSIGMGVASAVTTMIAKH